MAPIIFLFVIAGERINDSDDARLVTTAHEIEIEHALDGSGLHAPHDRFGFVREQRRFTAGSSVSAL